MATDKKTTKKDGKDKKPEINPERLAVYIGNDLSYWDSLKEKLTSAYTLSRMEFMQRFETKPVEIQNLFVFLRELRPKIIFIDFSKHPNNYLHLARLLARVNITKRLTIIGLIDYRSDENFVAQCVLSGINLNHIKSGEISDVVFDAMYTSFDDIALPPFALAKLSDDSVIAASLCKVTYATNETIHVEANHKFAVGEEIEIDSYWHRKKISQTPLMTVAETHDEDLFFNFKHGMELGFNFVEEVGELIDDDEEAKERLYDEREEKVKECKELMHRWVKKNQTESKPKISKILFVDKSLQVYRDRKRSDEYPFVIRVQPYIKFPKKEIGRLKPHVIVFNYEEVTAEELQANQDVAYSYNESNTLKHMVKTIDTFKDYNPYLIVFNAIHSSEELQKYLKYANIVVSKAELNVDVVMMMAGKLSAKIEEEYEGKQRFSKVILDKKDPLSIAEYQYEINLQACTESYFYFKSQIQFEMYQTIRVKEPVDMYLTIVPLPAVTDYPDCNFALVNVIGEAGKKDMRQFINSVFFREKEAAKEAERLEFEQLKESAIAKKSADKAEADAKKSKEEAEKEAKEGEAD